MLPVDGFPLHEDRSKQNTEGLAIGDAHSPIPGWHEMIQPDVKVEASKKVVDQRQRSQPLSGEREAGGIGVLTLHHLASILSQDMNGVNP